MQPGPLMDEHISPTTAGTAFLHTG